MVCTEWAIRRLSDSWMNKGLNGGIAKHQEIQLFLFTLWAAYIHSLFLPRPIHYPFLCCITGKYTSQRPCQLASRWVWKGKCRRRLGGQKRWRQGTSPCLTHLVLPHLRQWACPCHGSVFHNSSPWGCWRPPGSPPAPGETPASGLREPHWLTALGGNSFLFLIGLLFCRLCTFISSIKFLLLKRLERFVFLTGSRLIHNRIFKLFSLVTYLGISAWESALSH